MSSQDSGIIGFLSNVNDIYWKNIAQSLKAGRFMPGGEFTLVITGPAPNVLNNDTFRSNGIVADIREKLSTLKDDTVLNKILSFRDGKLVPGVSFHRFSTINGNAIRFLGMNTTNEGHKSTVAIVTIRFEGSSDESQVALKWSRSSHDEAIDYERNVLRSLKKTAGVVNLLDNGELNRPMVGKSVLAMHNAYSHESSFANLDVLGLHQVSIVVGGVLDKFHARGLVHDNVSCQSVRINPTTGHICITGVQYTSLSVTAGEELKQKAATWGIGTPPIKSPSRNLAWFDGQPVDDKRDSLLLGAVLVSCMFRDAGFFLYRGAVDLSKLGDGSDACISRLLREAVSAFNEHIAEGDTRLQMGIGFVQVVQALLRQNPEERISCGEACRMVSAQHVPRQVREKIRQVPAMFNHALGEMQRPFEIFLTDCMDQDGNPVEGYGIRSLGGARANDLICTYSGLSIDRLLADILAAHNQGHSIKNHGKQHYQGGLKPMTILTMNWLVEHGPASLANCNCIVTTKRDRRGGRIIFLEYYPATAYWDTTILPHERKLPIPGDVWSDAVVALRAATNVADGEEFVVNYGSATTRAMFVPAGSDCIVRKRGKA